MPFARKLLFAAALTAIHSFQSTLASALAAADPVITPAPTKTSNPDLDRRQVAGGSGTPILSTLHYAFTNLPEQVYPFAVLRGPQFGYNICNSTTLGDSSLCQTLIFNGPDDFCLWGSPDPNGTIGDEEARVVAYCTKPYHGSRLIAPGSITGLQWTKTPGYIQAVGFIKNSGLSLDPNDEGGELDPHGSDLQGNPLGGVVFSNGTTDSDGHTLTQVFNWNTFVGGNKFCFKACYNSITSPDYCENRYDLIGCDYNMPSAAQDGQFTSCDGDVQDVVGVYTTNGQTVTWSMPDPLNTPPPYQPRIPASSNCQTFQSSDLFLAATGVPSGSSSTTATTTHASTGPTGSTGSQTNTASGPTNTAKNAASHGLTLPLSMFAFAFVPIVMMFA